MKGERGNYFLHRRQKRMWAVFSHNAVLHGGVLLGGWQNFMLRSEYVKSTYLDMSGRIKNNNRLPVQMADTNSLGKLMLKIAEKQCLNS